MTDKRNMQYILLIRYKFTTFLHHMLLQLYNE